MVINHLLNGMILQVGIKVEVPKRRLDTLDTPSPGHPAPPMA